MKTKIHPLIIFLTMLTLTSLSCILVNRVLDGSATTPTAALATVAATSKPDAQPTATPKALEAQPTATRPAEQPQDAPADLGEVYREAAGGFAFQQIAGWKVEGGLGIVSMTAPGADMQKGPGIGLIGGLEDADTTLDEQFTEFTAGVSEEGNVEISSAQDIVVNGAAARRVEISGTDDDGQAMAGSVVVAQVTERQTFVMMGYAPADVWQTEVLPLFDAVLATVIFFAPEETGLPSLPDEPPATSDQLVRSWASAAEATSEYGSSDWTAMQAVGAPDTPNCGDYGSAWAASSSNTIESITLYYYDAPVVPTEINIIQTYNPSQVVLVEVLDASGNYETVVYESQPEATDECPYTLSIPVTDIDYLVMGVRITIDQAVLGLGWNEIDAVELVGYPAVGFELQPTQPPAVGENVWENVYALPIFESAANINYQDEMILSYTVSGSTRQEVLDFILAELEGIGWLTDVDEDGNCRNAANCLSSLAGLDYDSPENVLWYFIHVESPDSTLTLTLVESAGMVVVGMALP
jgi:hypothetical protein